MKIESNDTLSNTTFHRRCVGKQGYWWLRGPDGFVEIGEHRGDQHLAVEIDLTPGEYTLGAGPSGKFGRRQRFTVAQ